MRLNEKEISNLYTHHGPITHSVERAMDSFCMMLEPVKDGAILCKNKTAGYKGFKEMRISHQVSSNNTVYA